MLNCSIVPATVPSDSGIAGSGVLLSFIITAGVSLILSAAVVFQDTFGSAARRRKIEQGRRLTFMDALSSRAPSCCSTIPVIARKVLSGYSDQQILTGIGIQSLGLTEMRKIVPYHFFLIWMMGLLSTAVHNASLLALVHDFRRDCVLRWLRITLMFANLVLSCIYGVFIVRGLVRRLPPTLPIFCVWENAQTKNDPGVKGPANAFQFVATIAIILANVVIFILASWYLHNRLQRYYRIIQTVGLVLMALLAIGATIRLCLLSQAFGHPSVPLADDGEKAWDFGQLLSLLMLLLPLISVIEITRGEITVAPPVLDDPADLRPLVSSVSAPVPSAQHNSLPHGPSLASLRAGSHETGPRSEAGASSRQERSSFTNQV